MVALSAVVFCSSQNSTVRSSSRRFSITSGSMVGATQLLKAACMPCGMEAEAPLLRLCKKSKPGTNLAKPAGSNPELSDVAMRHAPKKAESVECRLKLKTTLAAHSLCGLARKPVGQ